MAPGLLPGDFLVASDARELRRGDVVVVEHPGRPGFEMVKRLAAMPGDTVDGRALATDEHWVVGDHPSGSVDSRAFGPIGGRAIQGVVRFRYWPPGRAGRVRRAPAARGHDAHVVGQFGLDPSVPVHQVLEHGPNVTPDGSAA
jgi:signal peptidase I